MTQSQAILLASLLMVQACGGIAERDPPGGITAVCWVAHVRFYGGSREWLVLDSPADLEDESFWSKVETIEEGHACPALPEEHALVGNGL